MRKISLIISIIIGCLIIFFSSQSGATSSALSTSITQYIIEIIIGYDENSKSIISLANANEFIRSMAHFSMFFILGASISFYLAHRGVKSPFLKAFIICFFFAITDEVYQEIQGMGRAFEFVDLIKDWLGSALGILLISTIINIHRSRNSQLYKKHDVI